MTNGEHDDPHIPDILARVDRGDSLYRYQERALAERVRQLEGERKSYRKALKTCAKSSTKAAANRAARSVLSVYEVKELTDE